MNVLCFGIAKDITGQSIIELENITNVQQLRDVIETNYPAFKDIKKCMIAVNEEYADDDQDLNSNDAIAIIPPVSGG